MVVAVVVLGTGLGCGQPASMESMDQAIAPPLDGTATPLDQTTPPLPDQSLPDGSLPDLGAPLDASLLVDQTPSLDDRPRDLTLCGMGGQPCCEGLLCNSAAVCFLGNCIACGKSGQSCCAFACEGNLVCDDDTCLPPD